MVTNTRLYGAAIAAASGLYSLWSATTASRMVTAGWIMAAVGVVVLVHGAVLLTDEADRLGASSGALMVGYAVVMLLVQALLGADMLAGGEPTGMDGMGSMGGMGETASAMGWDAGMVTLAALMLVSGLIMLRQGDEHGGGM